MFRALFATSFTLLLLGQGHGQAPTLPTKPLTLAQVWTLNATYNDQQHGVTFHYPSSWKAAIQFGYHPPALTQSDEAKPIAGFAYSEGGFPRAAIVGPYAGANLEGFGVVYSVVAAASRAECEARASKLAEETEASEIETSSVAFGNRSFATYETGEAGMSQSISGKLYATYAKSTCYLFETGLATASPGAVETIKALTPAQIRFIDAHLLAIMKTVRIVPE